MHGAGALNASAERLTVRVFVGDNPAAVDFTGFECRWEPIPAKREAIIALLIQAQTADRSAASAIYKEAIATIEAILEGDGHPVAVQTLKLATQAKLFEAEARLLSGRISGFTNWLKKTRASIQNRVGRTLLARDIVDARFDVVGLQEVRYDWRRERLTRDGIGKRDARRTLADLAFDACVSGIDALLYVTPAFSMNTIYSDE